jgi:hypothetical protein
MFWGRFQIGPFPLSPTFTRPGFTADGLIIISLNHRFAISVSHSFLSHAKVPGGVGNWGSRNSESERIIGRVLGNYHHSGLYGGITDITRPGNLRWLTLAST